MSMPSIATDGRASIHKGRPWPAYWHCLSATSGRRPSNVLKLRHGVRRERCDGLVTRAIAPAQLRPNLASTGTVAPADMSAAVDDDLRQRFEDEFSGQREGSGYDWARNWYPMATVSDLNTDRPASVQLLGKQIAVWRDGATGAWHAVEDRCPHRLAALSDGHVSSKGDIVCPYHGWQFDGEGTCTHNPQAIDAAAEHTACSSSRSHVAAYPVQARHGLLWLWGQAGSEEFIHSAAQPPPTAPEADDPDWIASPYSLVHMDGVDYATVMENSCDPSHANFVHNGLLQAWADAVPMFAKLGTTIDPLEGFRVEHSGYSKSQEGLIAERHFLPPCTLRATYKSGSSTTVFAVHSTPVRPGVCTTFFRVVMGRTGVPTWTSRAARIMMDSVSVPWLTGFMHMAGNAIADQDMLVLHRQDQRLHRAEVAAAAAGGTMKRGWRQFYLATPSDVGVDAYRRWLDMAGGGPQYEGDHPYPDEKSLEQLQDRWIRHVSHCKDCQQTVQVLDTAAGALDVASWASFAAAVWQMGVGASGRSLLGAGLGAQTLLGVPVPLHMMAAAALLQLLRGHAEAARKQFHVPERAARYPLNPPGV